MSTVTATALRGRSSYAKPILWSVIALALLSVFIYTDYPLLHQPSAYRTKLIHDRFLLIPHAAAAFLAMVLGPLQFSTRLRQRYLKWHRISGRIYVVAIMVTAPFAFVMGLHGFGVLEGFANSVLAALWVVCTGCAFITARNRQIAAHRQWMIRSYVVTLNFIFTRVLNPIPAYFNMSNEAFGMTLLFLAVCYLLFTDLAFSWRELTHSRAGSAKTLQPTRPIGEAVRVGSD